MFRKNVNGDISDEDFKKNKNRSYKIIKNKICIGNRYWRIINFRTNKVLIITSIFIVLLLVQ